MKKILFIVFILILTSCNKNIKRFYVNNASIMQTTIEEGDYIELDTSIKEFNYGDIVLVDYYIKNYPDKMSDFFRIVGMPKDSISVQNGICIINGKKCNTTFIRDEPSFLTNEFEEELPNGMKIRIHPYSQPEKRLDQSTIYVPSNHYYVLGDFRTFNADSRVFGTITNKEIVGKVVKIEKAEKKQW